MADEEQGIWAELRDMHANERREYEARARGTSSANGHGAGIGQGGSPHYSLCTHSVEPWDRPFAVSHHCVHTGCTDSALHVVLRMGIGGFGSGSSRRGSTNSSSSNSRAAAAAAAAVRRAGEGFGLLTEDGGNGADADARYHLLQDPTDDWSSKYSVVDHVPFVQQCEQCVLNQRKHALLTLSSMVAYFSRQTLCQTRTASQQPSQVLQCACSCCCLVGVAQVLWHTALMQACVAHVLAALLICTHSQERAVNKCSAWCGQPAYTWLHCLLQYAAAVRRSSAEVH
eukprot:14820-Heterococcus_DN1.PRE.2